MYFLPSFSFGEVYKETKITEETTLNGSFLQNKYTEAMQ